MAYGDTTLTVTYRIAADQATQTLKALGVAANEAGVQVKNSLLSVGNTAKSAGDNVIQLGDRIKGFAREQRSEARAVSFFVGELQQIVPVSNEARMALAGIGQAFVGGLGIVSGIALVVSMAGALATAFRNAAEEAAKITREVRTLEDEISVLRMGGGASGAKAALDSAVAAKMAEIRALNRALEERRNSTIRFLPEEQNLESQIKKAQLELEKIRIEGGRKITEAERAESEERIRIAQREASEKAKAARSEYDERLAEARFRAAGGAAYGESEAANMTNFGASKIPKLTESQAAYNKELSTSIALADRWGQVMGAAFADIILGEMSVQEAFKGVLQMAIKNIITYAAVAAARAAIPGAAAGPPGAAASMWSTQAIVLGMLGALPSARGGWYTGDYEGLAMVHKQEMVLPAELTQRVLKGTSGVTINVAAYDSRGFDRVLSSNSSSLARELRRLRRKGVA